MPINNRINYDIFMQWNIKQQKEWTTTSHTIDESYKCNAEQKKPDTKCMLYHSVLSISKHAKVPMVLGILWGNSDWKGDWGGFGGSDNVLFLIWVLVTWCVLSVYIYQSVHIFYTLCILHVCCYISYVCHTSIKHSLTPPPHKQMLWGV